MWEDLTKELKSSFLSCEKDVQQILKKLFVKSGSHSEDLKRLLVINTKDCLDNKTNPVYNKKLKEMSLAKMKEQGYFRLEPKLSFGEHEEIKTYLLITMDNFTPTSNPQYRDCTITFNILSHPDYWDLGDFRLRPLKIAGYIDGILNGTRLSGIGQLQFLGCSELVLDESLAGYTLIYSATHGNDDKIPGGE